MISWRFSLFRFLLLLFPPLLLFFIIIIYIVIIVIRRGGSCTTTIISKSIIQISPAKDTLCLALVRQERAEALFLYSTEFIKNFTSSSPMIG